MYLKIEKIGFGSLCSRAMLGHFYRVCRAYGIRGYSYSTAAVLLLPRLLI